MKEEEEKRRKGEQENRKRGGTICNPRLEDMQTNHNKGEKGKTTKFLNEELKEKLCSLGVFSMEKLSTG